jgi:hypothetical protein
MSRRYPSRLTLLVLVGFASIISVSCTGTGDTPDAGMDGDGGIIGDRRIGECTPQLKCRLHSDCCNCLALAQGEDPPPCGLAICEAKACVKIMDPDLIGGTGCIGGRCVAFLNCSSDVSCRVPTPECDPGEVPTVIDDCWGPCVPASDCPSFGSCSNCDPAFYVCVEYRSTFLIPTRCIAVPPECESDRTCECLEEHMCLYPYDRCVDGRPEENKIICEYVD